MLRSKGIGIIPYKIAGQSIRYLLLHHGGEYWNFPKGHQEGLEEDLQTALRELDEETGIKEVKIIDGFLESYDYDFDTQIKDGQKEKIYRRAIFYLGDVGDQPVKISDEHVDFGWFDYETAFKRLFHQNSQDLLKKAHQFLLKQQDIVL
jgi:8-oxo-dGTP pyrophosphatase MutT (NUDIX family)